MRKNKKFLAIVIASVLATSMSACSLFGTPSQKQQQIIQDNTPTGAVSDETSTQGIKASSPDFESKLTSDTYYVVHEDVYYPVYSSHTVGMDDNISEITSPSESRMRFYTLEDEIEIPTLYPGDQLIFYSDNKLTDVIHWERFYDMGITFGIYNLTRTEGGRYYLDFADDDNPCVFEESELAELSTLGVDNVLIDKVGDIQITDAMVEDGIIKGASKNQTYDMEVYTGTIYKHYNAIANFHAFRSYEVYASLKYTTLRDNFFEIEIPSCFTTGYYDIDGMGMFRLCKDYSYSQETDYNVQVLYPAIEGIVTVGEDEYISYSKDEVYSVADYEEFLSYPDHPALYTSKYSEDEAVNQFTTNITGTPGFVDPSEKTLFATEDAEDVQQMSIAKQIRYDLWFPAGKDCEITIPTDEGTGEAYILFANGSINGLIYNKLDKQYETKLSGQDIRGTIVIGGLTKGYDINLKNVVIYENQDGSAAAETE